MDPMDKFEPTLRMRTKTWGLFMTRGRCTCVVKVEYKKKSIEDAFIPPNSFDKTFEELGIISGAQLIIIEMRHMGKMTPELEFGEEGEEEMEEMEEEMDEDQLGEEVADDAKDEDGADPQTKIEDANADKQQ